MAVQNPPIFIQAGTHPAEDTRRFIDALLDSREGIVGSGELAVTENGTPNMSVNVAAGRAFVNGSQSSFQGSYFVDARSVTNVAVTAADATNPRKDLVVAKVEDAAYSGGTSAWSLAVVAGTPAGSPAEPAAPANSMVLAMIDVPANDTAITNSQIIDRRTTTSGQGRATALGGVIVCTSTSRPSHSEGRVIYETDTDKLRTSDGAAWNDVGITAPLFVRKTADESVTSSTTLQNDNHLFLSVATNTTYILDAFIIYDGQSAGDLKYGWTAPASATLDWTPRDLSTTVGATMVDAIDMAWLQIGSTETTGAWATTWGVATPTGLLQVSGTSGTLQLQWAQDTSNATATRVKTNSWLRLQKVS